ncbi:MAG: O-antigen ligase family protein [Deltaproteobacteria bacterium]|nr:O-antigen ligase family protein [Deltaproteobacteria bacterium]
MNFKLEMVPLAVFAYCFIRGLRDARWLFLLVLAASSFPVSIGSTIATPYKVALLVALTGYGVRALTSGRLAAPHPTLTAVILLTLLSRVLFLAAWEESLFSLAGPIGALLCILICSQAVKSAEDLVPFGHVLVILTLTALGMVVQELSHVSLSGKSIVRADGPHGDPNSSAVYATCNAVLALPWISQLGALWRWTLGILLAGAVVGIIFYTNSRGATVAIAVAGLSLAVVAAAGWRARFLLVGGFAVLTLVAAMLAPASYVNRQLGTFSTDVSGREVIEDSMRGDLNRIGLRMMTEAPVVGHGTPAFRATAARELGTATDLHNAWLYAVVAQGLPIGSLYLLIHLLAMAWSLRVAARSKGLERVAAAAVFANLLMLLIFYSTNPSSWHPAHFICLGIAAQLYRAHRRPTSDAASKADATAPQPMAARSLAYGAGTRSTGVQPEVS